MFKLTQSAKPSKSRRFALGALCAVAFLFIAGVPNVMAHAAIAKPAPTIHATTARVTPAYTPAPASSAVTTYKGDNSRDGQYSSETILNQSNVNVTDFGKRVS